jgi:hypothetical protein
VSQPRLSVPNPNHDVDSAGRFASRFRCGPWARWLPRVLAGAVLTAALLAAQRIEHGGGVGLQAPLLVTVAGAILALWVLRQGSEVRIEVEIDDERLLFVRGAHRSELGFPAIESLTWAPSFSLSRTWVPGCVLLDDAGRHWRLSALLRRGDELVREIVRRAEREDLATWAEERALERHMGRTTLFVALGYSGAAAILAVALAFYWRP